VSAVIELGKNDVNENQVGEIEDGEIQKSTLILPSRGEKEKETTVRMEEKLKDRENDDTIFRFDEFYNFPDMSNMWFDNMDAVYFNTFFPDVLNETDNVNKKKASTTVGNNNVAEKITNVLISAGLTTVCILCLTIIAFVIKSCYQKINLVKERAIQEVKDLYSIQG
jgi:hypothetical protein